uniref:Uncharacterized protein n=1 Tax=Ciona savignyi TaxID=51511 RepID=H2ZAM0_CIOSA
MAVSLDLTQQFRLHHFSPLPHLNCSGLGHTNLNVEGVVADTKTITVSYNDLVEFDVDNLEIFVTLVKLELQMNNLVRVLPSKINLEISTMEYISVSNNKLEIVPTLAFKAFPNLKYLLMHSNNIQRIEPTDFRFNPKLWYLQFGPNPITNFNEEWMGNVNLTGLGLQGCGLRQVPTNLQRMTGLMLLDLSNNLINTVSSNSFNKLTSLVYLLLSTNRIEFIDKAAFKGATKL